MSFPVTFHLAALLMLSVFPASARELVRTNQPAATNIVRYEAARMPSKGALWHPLPKADGEFALSVIQGLKGWNPRWEGSGPPGCILPPPNDFALSAVTKNGGHYYVTFTTGARLVWIGNRLMEVPGPVSTQIVQRVEKVLKK